MIDSLASLGLAVPEILLPRAGTDLSTWAVVAADQYTSQRDYWTRVDERVGDAPSTLRLVLPEVYLEDPDVDQRIAKIRGSMRAYLEGDVFAPPMRGFVCVDRKTSHAASRKGLVVALDLERYDYHAGASALIRATEGTVEARLPPRVKVRRGAPIELPHVMVLIDDPGRTVIEPLAERAATREPLYDFELMEGGGAIRGWTVTDEDAIESIARSLAALAAPEAFRARYGVDSSDVLLYAMGDGNHSLASAKVHWENTKKELTGASLETHPARHALVELVNVHDEGLQFEPIHRVVFGVDGNALIAAAPDWYSKNGSGLEVERTADAARQRERLSELWARGAHAVGFVTSDSRGVLVVSQPRANLAVGSLQPFLDEHVPRAFPSSSIDYIHGDDVVEELSKEPGRIGFLLPSMDKGDLFKTVLVDGVTPRKTFSMGEADEKRFYLEARKIVP